MQTSTYIKAELLGNIERESRQKILTAVWFKLWNKKKNHVSWPSQTQIMYGKYLFPINIFFGT